MTPEIEHALKVSGHRLTHPRGVVVRGSWRVAGASSPPNRCTGSSSGSNPGVSLSNVYRTLNLLEKLGVARRKGLGGGRYRYGLRAVKPTQHARCDPYGATIEFSEEPTDYLALQVQHDAAFVADSSELTLHGHCAACAAREPRARAGSPRDADRLHVV